MGIAVDKQKAIIGPVLEEGIGPRGFMESFQYVLCSKDSLEDALGHGSGHHANDRS